MRYLNFLILFAILLASTAGLIYFSRQFFDSYEKTVATGFQVKLSMLQLTEAERPTKFLQEKPVTLLFVGDIMLSRGVANQINKHQDYKWPFLKIASSTQEADLSFGNLEGPISDRGENQGSIYSFRAKPETIEGLKFAGFDILSLANNHIWDWGGEALIDTINILKNNDIEPVGVGKNYEAANMPIIKEINDSTGSPQVKIAFLAYTDLYPEILKARSTNPGQTPENSAGISDFDIEKIKDEIKYLKESQAADIVIISLHWGEEYQTHSNLNQQNIAHELIDAGADLIVGYHPHVVQETEQYGQGWIAYSLGNFVFDQNFSEETMEGLMLKVIVKNKKISEVLPLKIKINNAFQPEMIEL